MPTIAAPGARRSRGSWIAPALHGLRRRAVHPAAPRRGPFASAEASSPAGAWRLSPAADPPPAPRGSRGSSAAAARSCSTTTRCFGLLDALGRRPAAGRVRRRAAAAAPDVLGVRRAGAAGDRRARARGAAATARPRLVARRGPRRERADARPAGPRPDPRRAERVSARDRRDGCGAGGWCSAAARPTGPASPRRDGARSTRRSTRALGAAVRRRAATQRRPRRVGAERRALARRHPDVLPVVRRAGDAAGRARAARPAPAAPRAGAAGDGRARRPPRRQLIALDARDARPRRARRRARSCARSSRTSSAGSRSADCARRSPARSTAPRAPAGRGRRDVDWDRTIRAQPAPLPAGATGRSCRRRLHRLRPPPASVAARRRSSCVDQCGSMAASVVYSASSPRCMASMRARGDEPRRLRHLGRRSHRPARRPGRGPVRDPARRRHRHQPGARATARRSSRGRATRSSC